VTGLGADSAGTTIVVPDGPRIQLAWAAVSDVGRRRAANEDSFIARSPIFAVADGMGGHLSGDLASAAVVNRLDEYISDGFSSAPLIERALREATNDIAIIAGDSEIGVGTTVTGALLTLIDGVPTFAVFNIGDSRVYVFEKNRLKQTTIDHSLVQEMLDAGEITKAQAARHPHGNIITRAVGFQDRPTPDISLVPLRAGLRLVVCSDGLTGELDDKGIRLNLAARMTAHETASALVDAALASGGRDNVTVIIVDVLEVV
jgi:protein phosphatase